MCNMEIIFECLVTLPTRDGGHVWNRKTGDTSRKLQVPSKASIRLKVADDIFLY